MTMIEEAGPFLQDFNNNRIEDGHSPLFRDLFSEEASEADDTTYDREDDSLDGLEEFIRKET